MIDQSTQLLLQRLDQLSGEFHELREGVLKAVRISDDDPEMALTRARKVLEYVVRDVFELRCKEEPGTRPLENLLQRVVKDGHMPKRLGAYANHIREFGNIGTHAHGEEITKEDVRRSLENLMTILEWYFEAVRPGTIKKAEDRTLEEEESRPRAVEEEARRRAEEEQRQEEERRGREEEERRNQKEKAAALALAAEERKRGEAEASARVGREDEERTRERAATVEPVKAPPATRLPAKSRRLWLIAATAFVVVIVGMVAVWRIQNAELTPSQKKSTAGQSPTTRQEKSFSENINVEMVLVPGGTFEMGSPEWEAEREDNEGPQHRVTVPSFYMGKYEVTQAQWRAVMGTNPSEFKGDDRPVENVSWNDAVEFCRKLSQMTGRDYRLPSEAEWEYAARAGTTTPFAFGSSLSSEQANFDGNNPYGGAEKGVFRQQTTPIGSFQPNAFGLYDMHGNVQEWCADVWHENYNGAPGDGSAWLSGAASTNRVLRGGSWNGLADFLRSANRLWYAPVVPFSNVGFRVVAVART